MFYYVVTPNYKGLPEKCITLAGGVVVDTGCFRENVVDERTFFKKLLSRLGCRRQQIDGCVNIDALFDLYKQVVGDLLDCWGKTRGEVSTFVQALLYNIGVSHGKVELSSASIMILYHYNRKITSKNGLVQMAKMLLYEDYLNLHESEKLEWKLPSMAAALNGAGLFSDPVENGIGASLLSSYAKQEAIRG